MVVFALLGAVLLFGLIFGPQFWVKWTMSKHSKDRDDFPGTGAELARHILQEAGLAHVKVEETERGDHYSPSDKAIRLSKQNFVGKSITAVAVAAHEAAHALQDHDGYKPLHIRQKLAGYCISIERTGSLLLMATPFIFALTRSPSILVFEIFAALMILSSTVVIHVVTLPTEFDASFRRALPILKNYIHPDLLPAARSVLKAAAFTYVASALMSLIDIARWLRLLRF